MDRPQAGGYNISYGGSRISITGRESASTNVSLPIYNTRPTDAGPKRKIALGRLLGAKLGGRNSQID